MDLIISAVTPRSGSTLLQRICNARKENLIWGEHGKILKDFLMIRKKLLNNPEDCMAKQRHKYFNSGEDPNTYIAIMNPAPEFVEKMVIAAVKISLETLYSQYSEDHDLVGFKEVKYGQPELNLFREAFPETVILLLVRNPINIWESTYKTFDNYYNSIEQFISIWNTITADYYSLDKGDNNAYLIKYEDIISRDKMTLSLISELAKVTDEEIDRVLNCKLLSTSKEIPDEDRKFILKRCARNMELLNYM